MPTNEERREVAENVSKLALTSDEVVDIYVLVKVLGLKKPVHYDISTVSIESALRLSALINPEPERTCIPVVTKYHNEKVEDFYFVECSECKRSFGGMFFEKEKADAFARSLPTHYLKYCQHCGSKVMGE